MANLTMNRQLNLKNFPGASRGQSFQITDALQLYTGSYVFLSSGRLTQYDGATGSVIVGYVEAPTRDVSIVSGSTTTTVAPLLGETSATPIAEAQVETGAHILNKYSVTGVTAATDVGTLVYLASDDNLLTTTQPNASKPLGWITRWYSTTYCDVYVMSWAERRAYG